MSQEKTQYPKDIQMWEMVSARRRPSLVYTQGGRQAHGCVEMGLAVVSVQAVEEIGRAECLEVDLRQKHLRVQGSEAVNDSGGARAGPQEGTAGKSHRVQSSSGARSEQVRVRFQCCEGRAHTVHVMEGARSTLCKKSRRSSAF